jgi:hypothetical protein
MQDFFIKYGRDIFDAAMGAFVYVVYGVMYKKHTIPKAVASFSVGVISAMYAAPQIADLMEWANRNLIVFMCGMTGMRVVDALASVEFKAFLQTWVDSFLPKKK